MRHPGSAVSAILFVFLAPALLLAQEPQAALLAELIALGGKVGAADTRVRVGALHRVWTIGLSAPDSQTKLTTIKLLREASGPAMPRWPSRSASGERTLLRRA